MTVSGAAMSNGLQLQHMPEHSGRSIAAPALFQAFPPNLQVELRAGAIRKTFPDGQFLYHRGDAADGLWLIEKGQVKLGHYDAQGDMQALFIMGPGDSFGEMACIGRFPRVIDAQAMGNAEMLWISDAMLTRAITGSPEVMRELLRIFAVQLQEALDDLISYRNIAAPRRLAQRLLALGEGQSAPVRLGITQQEMAELIGVSRMTIVSALTNLEQQGLVKRHYRYLMIGDPEALQRWVDS
jgi:CRP/FNR family transcriptional regulator, cyclic AMP receptor protein